MNKLLATVFMFGFMAGIAAFADASGPATGSTDVVTLSSDSPALELKLEAERGLQRITRLGWDTEGTHRAKVNLLKSPIELRALKNNIAIDSFGEGKLPRANSIRFSYPLPDKARVVWETKVTPGRMRMDVSSRGDAVASVDRIDLLFPFEPTTAVTCVIANNWTADGKFTLPAILSAPDLGQLLMTRTGKTDIVGRIEGSRSKKWLMMTLEMPVAADGVSCGIEFTPVVLPMPAGFHDEQQWRAARRGWFNLIQLSCGASGGDKEVIGTWANNVLSDPVSSVLYMLTDATLLVPELAPGVTMPPILRRSVDYWIDHKTNDEGLIAYTARGTPGRDDGKQAPNVTDNQNVMDANPSVLIGAWGYVKSSGDTDWLTKRIDKLESIAAYLERHDVDGDGLIESKQSGNSGSRPPRDPDCAWDCYCSGHKNAYVSILTYRAWRDMAELERMLGRTEQERRFAANAEKLKAAFVPAFYNPATGWLGFWRSRDGVLHDIYCDATTSLAINYGLIDKDKGKEMLERFWRALGETGFTRFDLGTPVSLRPVSREEMEAYFEFKQFLNGGCCVSNTSYLLNAMYMTGMTEQGDRILNAMLARQRDGAFANGGGFQNGFVDHMGQGAEVFDWDGNPAGYEGHLVYCWAFLHSMLLREPALRDRVFGNCF